MFKVSVFLLIDTSLTSFSVQAEKVSIAVIAINRLILIVVFIFLLDLF